VSLREDSTRDMFTMAARGEIDIAIARLTLSGLPALICSRWSASRC
jgi:hypothetical protein